MLNRFFFPRNLSTLMTAGLWLEFFLKLPQDAHPFYLLENGKIWNFFSTLEKVDSMSFLSSFFAYLPPDIASALDLLSSCPSV